MSLKLPKMQILKLPELMKAAKQLQAMGSTQKTANNLFYLNIDDNYIHQLFPLLNDEEIKKPDYFAEKSAGAHITITYPEENKSIRKNDLQQEHSFVIKNIVAAEIGTKTYYAILVDSPSLLQLRRKYKLPDLLNFKGYSIGFHITIGYKILS